MFFYNNTKQRFPVSPVILSSCHSSPPVLVAYHPASIFLHCHLSQLSVLISACLKLRQSDIAANTALSFFPTVVSPGSVTIARTSIVSAKFVMSGKRTRRRRSARVGYIYLILEYRMFCSLIYGIGCVCLLATPETRLFTEAFENHASQKPNETEPIRPLHFKGECALDNGLRPEDNTPAALDTSLRHFGLFLVDVDMVYPIGSGELLRLS